MTNTHLHGVIAAIATAVDAAGEPDSARSTALARHLLANGCDGLNVLGTTGEATSFTAAQRMKVMTAYRAAALPLERMMVGTGAAALDDAIALTRHAAELGFAGALVLPPFYYKGVPDDGLFAYIEAIVMATAEQPIPIYLYHFPSQSGLPWHVALLRRLTAAFGPRLVGLRIPRRSAHAREAATVAPGFRVFPSSEAALMERARARSRAASRPPSTSTPTCARARSAAAMRERWRRRSRSENCSTASNSWPGSRRCWRILTTTPDGATSSRRCRRSRRPTARP